MRTQLTMAAVLAVTGFMPAAVAQNAELTDAKVRDFLKGISEQAQEAVTKQDWDGVLAWIGQNFADQAQFAVKGSMISTTGTVFTYSGTMGRSDVDTMASQMMAFRGLLKSMKDYRLETEVQSVSILPNGEATAQVLFRETAGIDPSQLAAAEPPAGQGSAPQGQAGASMGQAPAAPAPMGQDTTQEGRAASPVPTQGETQGSGLVFQSSSRCDMRMAPRAERIEIRIAACDTTTTF